MTIPVTADLFDSDESLQNCEIQFRRFGRPRVAGRIRTMCCHRHALLRAIVRTPGEGAVLVFDGGGELGTNLHKSGKTAKARPTSPSPSAASPSSLATRSGATGTAS